MALHKPGEHKSHKHPTPAKTKAHNTRVGPHPHTKGKGNARRK